MNWQLDQRVVEIFSELVANFALYGYVVQKEKVLRANFLKNTDSWERWVQFQLDVNDG